MRGGGHALGEKGRPSFLERVLDAHPAMFGRVMEKATMFRFQVLVSEVVEGDGAGPAQLLRHAYRVDHEYFYPASAIKLCGAVAAVQKVKHLKEVLGVDVNYTTPISFYPLFEGAEEEKVDSSNLDQHSITIAHEIRKLFLVSDNTAYNRLYTFVGHHSMNRAMWSLGLLSARLQHRLSMCLTSEENQYCEPVSLKLGDTNLTLPPKKSNLVLPENSSLSGVHVGTAYVTEDEKLVPEAMDFSKKNYMSLLDLQNLLVKLVRRDVELDSPPLRLDDGTRIMLMEAMSQYPSDSSNPKYNKADYPDDYCKFFLPGLSRVRAKGALRIYNKIGRAYGFTTDNAYIFDLERGRSFFLSAVLYTNSNGVLNDDKYEYEDIADRVMADLAEVVARAVWQIPPCVTSLSSPFDCIPSSLWAACSRPLTVQDSPSPAPEVSEAGTNRRQEESDSVCTDNLSTRSGYCDFPFGDTGVTRVAATPDSEVASLDYPEVHLSCDFPVSVSPPCSSRVHDPSSKTYCQPVLFTSRPLSVDPSPSPHTQTENLLFRLESLNLVCPDSTEPSPTRTDTPTSPLPSTNFPPFHHRIPGLPQLPLSADDTIRSSPEPDSRSIRACYKYFIDQ